MMKQRGAIYTPAFLVNVILDFGGFTGKKILHRHVMDNSCGDGAFLTEIVRRYCCALGKRNPEENVKETLMPYRALRSRLESTIIFNDYETFIDKICHAILAR